MSPRPHRRALLSRLLLLGVAGAGVWTVRNHLAWPEPKVSFTGGEGGTGWIDLPVAGGLIDVAAKVGRVWTRAVIDSGAQYSAIDASLAERLDLPQASPLPMVAFGVSGQPSLTRAVSLDLLIGEAAELRLTGLRAATLNLQPLSGLTRQPFSLLLGRDFLRAVTVEADFPAGRAAFFRPDAWRPFAGATAAPVQARTGALMTSVRIEDAPPVEVMVDTGATGGLALSDAAARAAGLLDGRRVTAAHSITLGGVGQDRAVQAETVVFAGRTFRDVDVQIYDPSLKGAIPNGLVGLGLLRRYRIGLELSKGRLWLGASAGARRGRRL